MTTRHHCSLYIESALKNAEQFVDCIEDENGNTLDTIEKVRAFFKEQQAMGRKVLPYGDCDNFDYETGCKGHTIDNIIEPPVKNIAFDGALLHRQTRPSADFKPVAAEPDTYKFRGKRISDDLWVSGCLVWIKDGAKWTAYIYGYGAVHPESIGLYTRLYDSEGNEICEGDIVVFNEAEDPDTEHGVVVLDDGKFKLKYFCGFLDDDLDGSMAENQIIIGNLFDGISEGTKQ